MFVRTVDDKASDTLVVVSDEGSWTGSSTLPHLHHILIVLAVCEAVLGASNASAVTLRMPGRAVAASDTMAEDPGGVLDDEEPQLVLRARP